MSRALAEADRRPLDAYYTPDDLAEDLVAVLPLQAHEYVIEPSAGGGAFVRALIPHVGKRGVLAIDVDPDAPALAMGCPSWCGDFLDADIGGTLRAPDWIIGNPPYREAEEHVRHAIRHADRGVAMLLRLGFLESQKEALWRSHPPAVVHVLTRRPSFTGGGTDSAAYGWFVWDNQWHGEPALRWLSW